MSCISYEFYQKLDVSNKMKKLIRSNIYHIFMASIYIKS